MKIELWYFSSEDCGICKVLKPKVSDMLAKEFSSIKMRIIDIQKDPEIAAQNMVFTLPVVLIIIDGKENYRFIRSFSINEIKEKLLRINSFQ